MKIKILDCTIRDGGYLNNWNFNPGCVAASYYAATKSGVDYFEIGYRFPEYKSGLGPFAYCMDSLLNQIIEPSDQCKILAMINASDSEGELFRECNQENTILKGIRIASYPEELNKAIRLSEELNDKGYEIFLHLMVFSEFGYNEIRTLTEWNNKDILEAVYFADSFGALLPSDIAEYVHKLRDIGFNKIGFHAHNNLQLALANTLIAIEEKVDYVDASIFGMGRDAGNVPIEILMGILEKKHDLKYNITPYLEVTERYYIELCQNYKRGHKLQSLLSGLKNIHPSYVEELFNKDGYKITEILKYLDSMKADYPVSYSSRKLNKV